MRKVENCTCESRELLIPIRHFIEFLVKVGLVKVGLVKVGLVKVGLVKVGPVKVGPVKVGPVKVGLIKWTLTVYPRLLYIVSINYLF